MTGKHDCDQSAICHDNEQSFSCECPAGFIDRSPNKLHRPGRVCVKLVSCSCLGGLYPFLLILLIQVDECATGRHTCSAQADCRDLEEGYTCECREGYVDRSPNLASQPGRVCSAPGLYNTSSTSSASLAQPQFQKCVLRITNAAQQRFANRWEATSTSVRASRATSISLRTGKKDAFA